MPTSARIAGLQQVWAETWRLPQVFRSREQEQAFLQAHCRQFANHRRVAILIGILFTFAYFPWDFFYASDPLFGPVLARVLLNRLLTALMILPFMVLALGGRFARDERFATAVLTIGAFIDFVFYCRSFLLAPYPYDYMYFFMGMCVNVVFTFAMLQLRARPVLLVLALNVVTALATFTWNVWLKGDSIEGHAARTYQWPALMFLLTITVIGYSVVNLLERTRRASFAQTAQLAESNARLVSHGDEVDRLNQALQKAVERAERESAARTRVLASASHDLRQPLHALSIYSAVLAESPTPETLREVGEQIDQIAGTLGTLLHGLLDLSQLSSGHYVPSRERIALHERLEALCREFDAAAACKGLRLRRELAPVHWQGDPMGLARIVRNLLGNAVKYTAHGGVTVRLEARSELALLSITDTGTGIAPEAQSRIFEEFYQVGNQGRDRSQGVGLGLAIVRRLVDLVGGSITVDSVPGVGSRFSLGLPGVEAEPAAGEPQPAGAVTGAATLAGSSEPIAFSGRIYLVDDEADILHSMSMLLRSWQCEVFTAADTGEAEALFAAGGKPDLLIVDLRLRGVESGDALVERLQLGHGDFQVLVITGETASQALRGATRAGWTLLYKPIPAATLRNALAQLLPRR